jgi:hypothetical protein
MEGAGLGDVMSCAGRVAQGEAILEAASQTALQHQNSCQATGFARSKVGVTRLGACAGLVARYLNQTRPRRRRPHAGVDIEDKLALLSC